MIDHEHFARKVPAYFDGTLRDSEKTEFEAYVGTHPEFAQYFRQKEAEQNTLKLRVPDALLEASETESLEGEIKEIIGNLFVEDDARLTKKVSNWLKERL
ncbi:MAG: hypothetical protein K2P81_12125 [Bacteriovoracaceae bacterium]|nr:hypothetical protein [Bacteriovoracaceae bacterium]